jgi:hypothetical protein
MRSSSERAVSATRSSHSPGVSREMRRSTALTNPGAPFPPMLRASSTDSFTAACEAMRVASSWCVPRRSTSRTAGSMSSMARSAAIWMITS